MPAQRWLLCTFLAMSALFVSNSEAGAPSDSDLECKTLLLEASAKNDVTRVKSLLSRGSKPNLRTPEGFSALSCAANSGATDAVSILLENGADPNSCTFEQNFCPLWYAAMANHPDSVLLLIEKGAKLETENGWNANTALAWAVRNGKEKAVRVLVEKGASLTPVIKKEYYGGKTALQIAKKEGHLAVVEIIEKAANTSLKPTP